MAPNPKISKAFRAMKDIGISEDKTKPVLKKLLKLYDKNWELIEEENYRVLADAIFDEEDSKVHSFSTVLLELNLFLFLLCFSSSHMYHLTGYGGKEMSEYSGM